MPATLILCTVLLMYSVSVKAEEEEEDAAKSRAFDPAAARSMLADIARELIARSGTNSQVITLIYYLLTIYFYYQKDGKAHYTDYTTITTK